jgi:hypothetical protein
VPQWDKRPEEAAIKIDNSADAKPGETCVDGTSSRPSCATHRAIGGGEEEHGEDIG